MENYNPNPMMWDFEDEFIETGVMPPVEKPCHPDPCHHHAHLHKPVCPHRKTNVTITQDSNVYTVKENGLLVGQIIVPDYDGQFQTLLNKIAELEAEIEILKNPLNDQ